MSGKGNSQNLSDSEGWIPDIPRLHHSLHPQSVEARSTIKHALRSWRSCVTCKADRKFGILVKKRKRGWKTVRSFWNPGLGKFLFALVASTCAGRLAWGIHRCQGDLSVAAGSLSSEVGALFPWCQYPCQLTDILLLSLTYFHCTGRGWRPLWRPTPSGGPPCALLPLKTSLQCKSSKVSVQRACKELWKEQEKRVEEQQRALPCIWWGHVSCWALDCCERTQQRGWMEMVDRPCLTRCNRAASSPWYSQCT